MKHNHRSIKEVQGEGDMTYFCSCGARKYYVYGCMAPRARRSVKWVPAEVVAKHKHWHCGKYICGTTCDGPLASAKAEKTNITYPINRGEF